MPYTKDSLPLLSGAVGFGLTLTTRLCAFKVNTASNSTFFSVMSIIWIEIRWDDPCIRVVMVVS